MRPTVLRDRALEFADFRSEIPVLREDAPPAPSTSRAPVLSEKPVRPAELGDVEQFLYPSWLDYDQASGGPNYLSYVMYVMVVALLLQFAVMAAVVAS